ncbi:MAG: AGE family epimerase/isomerase, partial [Salinibacter sp.]
PRPFVTSLLAVLLVASSPASLFAQPADSLLQGSFWRTQGLEIMESWTQNAQTEEGLFYAELDRRWRPSDSTTQYPGMLARHLFSYSAAYLMSGDASHLRRAKPIVEFLIEHGWDETYGGWYNAVTRSGRVVDAEKDLFMQIYATTGLALYTIATRDERARTYLRRSRDFLRTHAWDDEHGGYVDVLRRDGSVKNGVKDFSPQLAPLSGYLLYLYPATGDSSYLREAERIMELTLTHMQNDRGWIRERFAQDWTFLPKDPKNSHLNVGHNAEVAWLLFRLHALTGKDRYRRTGLALTDKLLRHAFHEETGAWLHKLKRTNLSQHPDEAVWWVQAYGNMLQLYAYRTTGDERYLDAFRKGARFWNEAFVDEKHGGTVLKTTLDGTVTAGDKAVRTKTSYHALEHALLTSLYLDLWANDTATSVHYRFKTPQGERLRPLPIEDTPHIERVLVNGTPQAPPDTVDRALRLPSSGPVRLQIDLSSASP